MNLSRSRTDCKRILASGFPRAGPFHLAENRSLSRDFVPLRAYLRLKAEFLLGTRPTASHLKGPCFPGWNQKCRDILRIRGSGFTPRFQRPERGITAGNRGIKPLPLPVLPVPPVFPGITRSAGSSRGRDSMRLRIRRTRRSSSLQPGGPAFVRAGSALFGNSAPDPADETELVPPTGRARLRAGRESPIFPGADGGQGFSFFRMIFAVLWPEAPQTPPPGWVLAPVR